MAHLKLVQIPCIFSRYETCNFIASCLVFAINTETTVLSYLLHYCFSRGRGFRGQGFRGQRRPGRGGPRGRGGANKEALDNELDTYMSKTKSVLDNELDSYMASGNQDM